MMLIFNSCVNEEEPFTAPVSDSQLAVEDAKAWFGPQEEFEVPIISAANARVRNQIKKIHWNKAIVHEEGRVIEVEVTYTITSVPIRSAKTINDIKKKQKDAFFRLVLEKREDGGFDKFILKYFPEVSSSNQKKLQVNNYAIWSKEFSGDIQMISWDEELSTGWYVQNGEKVYTYFPKRDSGKKSRSNANAALNCTPILEEICINFGDDEEMDCSSGICELPEFGIECFDIIAYEDPNCSDQYNPGSGPGTYTGPGGGGGSGSGSGGGGPLPTLLPEDEIFKDPSFVGTKADCIYERLLASSEGFKGMIQKFDGEFSVSDIKFSLDDNLPNTTNGETSVLSPGLIGISLNQNTLEGRTNLGVARTLIHETIHAEMYRKVLSMGGQVSINDFPGIYDYYRRYAKNWQHEQMVAHYVDVIGEMLQEFDNYSQNYQFYEDFAWVGLYYFNDNNAGLGNYTYAQAWNDLQESEQNRIKIVMTNGENNGSKICN
jgi:hypothetical protein